MIILKHVFSLLILLFYFSFFDKRGHALALGNLIGMSILFLVAIDIWLMVFLFFCFFYGLDIWFLCSGYLKREMKACQIVCSFTTP